ncbi:MAG: hypothetical protein D8H99_33640 [Streptococcus sp.]|nr:MAG: hypothetical protein D8H99_33640 [Streptococcus sp.]
MCLYILWEMITYVLLNMVLVVVQHNIQAVRLLGVSFVLVFVNLSVLHNVLRIVVANVLRNVLHSVLQAVWVFVPVEQMT